MMPPGHIAGGFLVAKGLLALGRPALSISAQNQLVWWGMFFGFAPDLDTFVVFAKVGKFVGDNGISHRKFFSHAPILWLIAGLTVFLFGLILNSPFVEYFGLLAWLGSWSHFALDTVQHGVMWLWPWKKKVIALADEGIDWNIPKQDFLPYWSKAVKFYITRLWLSFSIELIVFITALVVYFR